MTVKRYDCELVYRNHWSQDQDASMEEYPDGEYVKHSDYAKLEQAIKRIVEDSEWVPVSPHDGSLICPCCGSWESDGHAEGCSIADAAKMVENV